MQIETNNSLPGSAGLAHAIAVARTPTDIKQLTSAAAAELCAYHWRGLGHCPNNAGTAQARRADRQPLDSGRIGWQSPDPTRLQLVDRAFTNRDAPP
jgi:hypothetical protein